MYDSAVFFPFIIFFFSSLLESNFVVKIVYISRADATVRKLRLPDERRLLVALMNKFGISAPEE
jgi:hypothetical protein